MADETVEILFKVINGVSKETERIVSSLSKVKTTADSAAQSGKQLSKTNDDIAKSSENASKGLDKIVDATKKTSKQVEDLGKKSKIGFAAFSDGVKKANTSITSIGIALASLGAAIIVPFTIGVKKAAEFEQSMATVKAVSGATNTEFQDLTKVAEDLGRKTIFTATQASEGLRFLSMAGFEAKQSIEALPGVLQLAQAGSLELGTAADIATNILTGYGKTASELPAVNDVMVAAFTKSNSTLEELGTAFAYVGPIAKGLGVDFEGLTAALGSLHNAGIKGSMAGTALRGALDALFNPTEREAELLGELSERIGGAGLQLTNTEGDFIGFVNLIEQLERAGITTAEALRLFGQRAGPAMAALVGQGSTALSDFQTDLELSGGTANRIAETMDKTTQGAFKRFWSAVDGLSNSLARRFLPAISAVVDGVASFINVLTEVLDFLGPLPTIVIALTAAMGGLALAVAALAASYKLLYEPLSGSISAMKGAFPFVAKLAGAYENLSIMVFRSSLAVKSFLLTNPVGWVIAAIAAVYALIKAYEKYTEITLNNAIEKQRILTDEHVRAEKASKAYDESIKQIQGDTEKQNNINLKYRSTLTELSKGHGEVAQAANEAAKSIDKNTGALLDNGDAIERFKQLSAKAKVESLAKDFDLMSQKLQLAAKDVNIFERAWKGVVELFNQIPVLFEKAVKKIAKTYSIYGEAFKYLFGFNPFEKVAKHFTDWVLGAKKSYGELSKEIAGYEGELTNIQAERKKIFDDTQKRARELIKEFKDKKLIEAGTTFAEFEKLVKEMGRVEKENTFMTDALRDAWTQTNLDAQKVSREIAESLKKSLLPDTSTKAAEDAVEAGFRRIQEISDKFNSEIINQDQKLSSDKITQFKLMFASLDEESRVGFIPILQTYQTNLANIDKHVSDSAEKQKLITAAKTKFIEDSEKLMLQALQTEYITKYKGIVDQTNETAEKQIIAVKAALDNEKISRVDAANRINEIEANKYAKLSALADEYVRNVEGTFSEESKEYKAAVKESIRAAEDLAKFKIDAAKRTSQALKAELDESIKKEKEYADKAISYTEKIRDIKKTTEERIRDIKRRSLTEEAAETDRALEAQEKLAQARKLIASGELKQAEELVQSSQGISASLKDQSQAMSGVKAAGELLISIYEQQKTEAEKGVLVQQNVQKTLRDRINDTSKSMDVLTSKLAKLKEEYTVSVRVDADQAKGNLQEFNELVDQTKAEIPVTVKVADEARFKLDQLTETEKKEINVVLSEQGVSGRIEELAATEEKVFVVNLDDTNARKAISDLEKTTYSQHIVYVRRVEQNNTGGLVGQLTKPLHLNKGFKLPGFGTTDTVPAMLTLGERVTNAVSTRIMDSVFPGFMEAVNRIKSIGQAKSLFDSSMLKLSTGGPVTRNIVGYANGGVVNNTLGKAFNNLGRIELQLGNVAFPMLGETSVVNQLKETLRREKLVRGQ